MRAAEGEQKSLAVVKALPEILHALSHDDYGCKTEDTCDTSYLCRSQWNIEGEIVAVAGLICVHSELADYYSETLSECSDRRVNTALERKGQLDWTSVTGRAEH